MGSELYVRVSVSVNLDTFYHLESAAGGLRAAMDLAALDDDYGKEAELGDLLTHVLLALANLPPKSEDLPF